MLGTLRAIGRSVSGVKSESRCLVYCVIAVAEQQMVLKPGPLKCNCCMSPWPLLDSLENNLHDIMLWAQPCRTFIA